MNELAKFKELMREINIVDNIINTLSWDMRVNLPPKAAVYRAETMGYLSEKLYALKTSPVLKDLCDKLSSENNDLITSAMIKSALKENKKLTAVPAKLYSDYAEHSLKTELLWQDARAKSDYSMLKNSLEKEFDYKRQFAECYGFFNNPMDGLVSEMDGNMTTGKLDKMFNEIKSSFIPLTEKIASSGIRYDKKYVYGKYSIDKQREFCKYMVAAVGYDFQAGRLDESAHPFSFGNDKTDIRMTTRYFEENFTSAAMSSMHEMGHSLYGQNHSDDLRNTTLARSPCYGWDEGQSRFFENIVGRSKPFWMYFLPIAKTYFDSCAGMTLDDFYYSLNAVNPDPVRLNADEITYNLHIIIRYELEKMIFAKEVSFNDLPSAWNQKYKEYMNVTPKDDASGVLQDMHWASGFIGTFQCYALGNCYDGHILNKMKKDIPDMYDQMATGRFDEIVNWQVKNVHIHGSIYDSAELLKRVTGEELSPTYYINYINQKYAEIYKL